MGLLLFGCEVPPGVLPKNYSKQKINRLLSTTEIKNVFDFSFNE
jgi:hypothetical protein